MSGCRQVVSLWTCSKLCAISFVVGVVFGYTLKRRVQRWASNLLKRLKDNWFHPVLIILWQLQRYHLQVNFSADYSCLLAKRTIWRISDPRQAISLTSSIDEWFCRIFFFFFFGCFKEGEQFGVIAARNLLFAFSFLCFIKFSCIGLN